MSSIKYKYAFDESRKIVSIDSVTDADRYNHTYYCISCGAELKPRLGSKNVHHFYHVNADASCSGETYLHTLAKYRLKDRFDSSEEFKISLYQYHIEDQEKVQGGAMSPWTVFGIGAAVVFIIGLFDGYTRPLKCNS